MRASTRSVCLVAALVALVPVGCTSDGGEDPLPEAQIVPLDGGEATTTTALTGERPTVVNIWASWCTPCIAEMPAFDEVHEAMGDEVTIVGITDDREEPARQLAEETGVGYPLYRDTERTLLGDLGLVNLPATYFVDPDGTIVATHQGPMDAEDLTERIDELWGTP